MEEMKFTIGFYIITVAVFIFGLLRGIYLYFKEDPSDRESILFYLWIEYAYYRDDIFSIIMRACFWVLAVTLFVWLAYELGNIFV